MSTPAQIAANQANAKLSTGPVTEAGRQAVSSNAVKHSLCGNAHAALPGEEAALEAHVEGYRKAYNPVGLPEESLVRNLAENHFRLRRAHAMETALFHRIAAEAAGELPASAAHAEAFLDPVKGLQRITLYANRIQRAIEKNTAELKSLQAERKAAFAQAQEEAILLTQLAHAKGENPDQSSRFPSPELYGGFVYSLPEVAQLVSRRARIEEAKMRFQQVG